MNSFKCNDFNNSINNIIGEFINDVDQFNTIINKNNIVLSGSSVLKAINNDTYEIDDLDIYVNSDAKLSKDRSDMHRIDNFMLKVCTEFHDFIINNADYELSSLMMSDENKIMNNLYTGMRSINYVFTLINSKNNKKIQVIVCDDYLDTIGEFDLSINKNYWDGKDITILDPKSVFTKHEKLSLHIKCKLDYYTLERIDKYRKRGYNIELTELTSLLPKSIYNSEDLVEIIEKTFSRFVFEP